MDDKVKIELMVIREMASLVIEKIDVLVPFAVKPVIKKGHLTEKKKANILARRRINRLR